MLFALQTVTPPTACQLSKGWQPSKRLKRFNFSKFVATRKVPNNSSILSSPTVCSPINVMIEETWKKGISSLLRGKTEGDSCVESVAQEKEIEEKKTAEKTPEEPTKEKPPCQNADFPAEVSLPTEDKTFLKENVDLLLEQVPTSAMVRQIMLRNNITNQK
jgi:uncharacterized protein with NAD-binding domain and iron-sulfur cluster